MAHFEVYCFKVFVATFHSAVKPTKKAGPLEILQWLPSSAWESCCLTPWASVEALWPFTTTGKREYKYLFFAQPDSRHFGLMRRPKSTVSNGNLLRKIPLACFNKWGQVQASRVSFSLSTHRHSLRAYYSRVSVDKYLCCLTHQEVLVYQGIEPTLIITTYWNEDISM